MPTWNRCLTSLSRLQRKRVLCRRSLSIFVKYSLRANCLLALVIISSPWRLMCISLHRLTISSRPCRQYCHPILRYGGVEVRIEVGWVSDPSPTCIVIQYWGWVEVRVYGFLTLRPSLQGHHLEGQEDKRKQRCGLHLIHRSWGCTKCGQLSILDQSTFSIVHAWPIDFSFNYWW